MIVTQQADQYHHPHPIIVFKSLEAIKHIPVFDEILLIEREACHYRYTQIIIEAHFNLSANRP
jgi:hypothetical protein